MSVRPGPRARMLVRATTALLAVTGTATAALLGPTAHADPEIAPVVARFDFDEAPGSTTFADHVGGLVGSIGSDVVPDGTGHVFATHLPSSGHHPGHVDVVPHSQSSYALLNPGAGNFQFTIRYHTRYSFGNIMQKGQGTQKGGYWKLENPNRKPRCLFRGGDGSSRTGYARTQLTKDWHTITCVRTPEYVEMWVDGVRQQRARGRTGTIRNTAAFSVGGKSFCDGGVKVSCDYFVGKIDFIEFRQG